MATLRNKRNLAAVTRETQEENPRNGQSRNTSVPRINEEYITQVSEEIEGRVSKKLSQEFSRTESRILGALSKLDKFLLNEQIRTHSETVPGTFRNINVENQGTNEDDSQSDPHPEVGPSVCQSRHSIDSDTGETHDTMTGVIEQTSKGPHSSRNGSGVRPYLWVQKKLIYFRQGTQNAGLCPAELVGQFFRDSAFNLLRNLCDIFLVISRNGRVS